METQGFAEHDDPRFTPVRIEPARRGIVKTVKTVTAKITPPRTPKPPVPYNEKCILYVRQRKYEAVVMHRRYATARTAEAAVRTLRPYGWQIVDPAGRVVAFGGK